MLRHIFDHTRDSAPEIPRVEKCDCGSEVTPVETPQDDLSLKGVKIYHCPVCDIDYYREYHGQRVVIS
jgi:hypothetical protein